MALQPCVECGHNVSSQAAACPSCGHPVEQNPFAINTGTTSRTTHRVRTDGVVTTQLTSKPLKLGMLVSALIAIVGGSGLAAEGDPASCTAALLLGLLSFCLFRMVAWWNHG